MLRLDDASTRVVKWEPLGSYTLRRTLRSCLRPVHTGEAGGFTGQGRINETTALRMASMGHLDEVIDRNEVKKERLGIAPSVTFALGPSTQLTVSYFLQHEDNIPDYGLPFLFGKPSEVSRESFYSLARDDAEDTRVNIGILRLDHRFNEHLSLRNTLRYARVDREAFPSPPCISSTFALLSSIG